MDGNKRAKKPPRKMYDTASIVSQWLSVLPPEKPTQWQAGGYTEEVLAAALPKRFMVYEPMVLFSPGAFTDVAWSNVLEETDESEKGELWKIILAVISGLQKSEVTHLAVNAGIPSHIGCGRDDVIGDVATVGENIMRSPVEISTLYGDFGPPAARWPPTPQDLDEAFWVSTKQNGIFQTWAPRYTMFSRGNITEKARILGFHSEQTLPTAGLERRKRSAAALRNTWAVDLYAGIGYFTFSYARLGMRVLCWEINPWSVEGLRKGALRNGWTVRVVQGEELESPVGVAVGDEQIVVFIEDNQKALVHIEHLRHCRGGLEILHVNGGLLPTSEDTWKVSWEITCGSTETWLHLHENIGEGDIEKRRDVVQRMFDVLADESGNDRRAIVEHVEQVKTVAPRVWHCVFDICITKLLSSLPPEFQ